MKKNKNKQYPAQDGVYAIKVKSEKSTDSWQDFDAVRLQISVGQDYHEGDKLRAAVMWAVPRFEDVTICVNDSLQRYNTMFETGCSAQEALEMSRARGRDWVARHEDILSAAPHVKCVHWDEWLADVRYEPARAQIQALYESNEIFQQAIDGNVAAIWERRQMVDPELYCAESFEHFAELSRAYLLEEITVFAMMFEGKRAIDAYPGTTIFAALVFKGRDVAGAPAGLGKGHFCRIDFSRRREPVPALQPQTLRI